MLTLGAGAWAATLLPDRGAAFATLTLAGADLLVPIPPGADPNAGFHGAFVMAPWTNRLDGGRFVLDGVAYRMPINRPAEDTSLHGLFRDRPWQVEGADDARAVLTGAIDHPPFRCAARMEVALDVSGLALALTLTNTGGRPTPLGIGWHPFFVRPPGGALRFAARTRFGRDGRGLPIDPRESPGHEGAPAEGLDAHFAGWDGVAEFTGPAGDSLLLEAAGDWRGNLQIFAPAGIVCVEPSSHAPDAANRAAAAAHGPMHVVPPGGALRGSLRIHLR